jgi:SAM-dependent methyltransferase
MPATQIPRQAGVSSWFATGAGRVLLQLQRPVALEALQRRPAQPWLWLSPCAQAPHGGLPQGHGVQLHRCGAGYAGELCCALPLPFASESLRAIVVEHALIEPVEASLEEFARVLMPGGQLYLFTLNPYSPYRMRWWRQQRGGISPPRWRALVQRVGLSCQGTGRYMGPVWRAAMPCAEDGAAWRAVCLLRAEKRANALVPPSPVPVRWRRPVVSI